MGSSAYVSQGNNESLQRRVQSPSTVSASHPVPQVSNVNNTKLMASTNKINENNTSYHKNSGNNVNNNSVSNAPMPRPAETGTTTKAVRTEPAATSTSQSSSNVILHDTVWLLEALAASATRERRLAGARELKVLVRTANDAYWHANCAQIISVLLESFTNRGGAENISASSSSNTEGILSFTQSIMNGGSTGYVSESTKPKLSLIELYEAGAGAALTSIQEDLTVPMTLAESMHFACKALLLLVRHRAKEVVVFLDLLAAKLCQAAAFAPAAVALHCEQILIDLAPSDALRLLRVLLPYTIDPAAPQPSLKASNTTAALTTVPPTTTKIQGKGTDPAIRLLALHVLAETLKHMPSPHILPEMPALIQAVIPSLSCSIVDLRKAVVFVLVEVYVLIGDALYPYVQELPPPQKKLLTIYIDRQMHKKSPKGK